MAAGTDVLHIAIIAKKAVAYCAAAISLLHFLFAEVLRVHFVLSFKVDLLRDEASGLRIGHLKRIETFIGYMC